MDDEPEIRALIERWARRCTPEELEAQHEHHSFAERTP